MKPVFPITILLIYTIVACNKHNQTIAENESAENSISLNQRMEKFWDSLCIAEVNQAKADIEKNKLVYTFTIGMVKTYKSDFEMDSLLAKHGISTTIYGFLCTALPDKQDCYGKEMAFEISKRYGSGFTDSLRQQAENIYVYKNRNAVFKFEDCDRVSRYYGTDDYSAFLRKYEQDFFRDFIYPLDFKHRNGQDSSYSNAYFILHKDGSVSDIKISSTFQNAYNEQFRDYFENQIEGFVKKTKWKPATVLGEIVNSEMRLTFFYK